MFTYDTLVNNQVSPVNTQLTKQILNVFFQDLKNMRNSKSKFKQMNQLIKKSAKLALMI